MRWKYVLIFAGILILIPLIFLLIKFVFNSTLQKTSLIPTPTIKPKIISKSSCVVVDEDHCPQGKPVYFKGKLFGVGFQLPKGSKFYTPFEGNVNISRTFLIDKRLYRSVTVNFQPKGSLTEEDLRFSAIVAATPSAIVDNRVEKGELIAEASQEQLTALGDYNLIFSFEGYDKKTRLFSLDLNLLKKYFYYVQP